MIIRQLRMALAAVIIMAFSLAGCTPGSPTGAASASGTSGTHMYVDDLGRHVRLPSDVERIAPSGPTAQLMLFALCPDKLVGLASMFSDDQFRYINQKYASLPVFGNIKGSGLNLEAVMKAQAQVIIDIGDPMSGTAINLDSAQTKTGIPTIFVAADLDSLASAYQKLGDVTGEVTQAKQLSSYITDTLTSVRRMVSTIPPDQRPTVYYGQADGLTGVAGGTTHATVLATVGATNVVQAGSVAGKGTVTVSMEKLMVWNPQVILFAPGSIYATVASDPRWLGLTAIDKKKYYEIPADPYNWIDQPPSINQILGIAWLANLLYPTVFPYDMVQKTEQFYQLFYHCALTDTQARALLANSTFAQ